MVWRSATAHIISCNREKHWARFRTFPLALLLVIALCSWSCKSDQAKRLAPARVHGITREMVHAASGFGKAGDITAHLRFDGAHAGHVDDVFVALPPSPSDQAQRESVARLIQALDGVATTNNLTRDEVTGTSAPLRLDYRSGGVITNSVHIIVPRASRAPVPTSPRQGEKGNGARLAIILDDLGSDRAAADSIFALSYPLTISVLPNHAHSAEIAEEAHRRGYEVMLHLPMQSVGNETPEAHELRPGMPAEDIPVLFEQMLQSVPNVVGVNNHQGSQATADAALMEELMPILQKWNLFYVDSRTTAATVAYDTAQRAGVRSAFRNVPFLDDVAEVSAVRKQLELAFRGAKEKGEAIAIGHPHAATLKALSGLLPQAEARGVHLVYASDLVH